VFRVQKGWSFCNSGVLWLGFNGWWFLLGLGSGRLLSWWRSLDWLVGL